MACEVPVPLGGPVTFADFDEVIVFEDGFVGMEGAVVAGYRRSRLSGKDP
jgi:hypothetical protein